VCMHAHAHRCCLVACACMLDARVGMRMRVHT